MMAAVTVHAAYRSAPHAHIPHWSQSNPRAYRTDRGIWLLDLPAGDGGAGTVATTRRLLRRVWVRYERFGAAKDVPCGLRRRIYRRCVATDQRQKSASGCA